MKGTEIEPGRPSQAGEAVRDPVRHMKPLELAHLLREEIAASGEASPKAALISPRSEELSVEVRAIHSVLSMAGVDGEEFWAGRDKDPIFGLACARRARGGREARHWPHTIDSGVGLAVDVLAQASGPRAPVGLRRRTPTASSRQHQPPQPCH